MSILDESVTISMLIWECFEVSNKLGEDSQITVLLLFGHRGIKGNEIADILAKLSTRQNPTGPVPVIGISNRSVTEDISKRLAKEHQKEWFKAKSKPSWGSI